MRLLGFNHFNIHDCMILRTHSTKYIYIYIYIYIYVVSSILSWSWVMVWNTKTTHLIHIIWIGNIDISRQTCLLWLSCSTIALVNYLESQWMTRSERIFILYGTTTLLTQSLANMYFYPLQLFKSVDFWGFGNWPINMGRKLHEF